MKSEPCRLSSSLAVGIALGANLGDRQAQMRAALDAILSLSACHGLLAQASLFESDPVDCPEGSGAFLNSVIEIAWHDEPLSLLHEIWKIEAQLGRQRSVSNAPRPIDLDLLYADSLILDSAELQLPHPRLALRRFVLEPLAEIRPGLILPHQSQPVSSLLDSLISAEAPLRRFTPIW